MSSIDVQRMDYSSKVAIPHRASQVALLTINRPQKSNALSGQLMTDFVSAVKQLALDDSLAALVVTGAGSKAFVGGADIAEMANLHPPAARRFISQVHQCCDCLRAFPLPVIARINGVVFGAGLELAASADLLVATEDARFGMPEVKLGLPSVAEAAVLPGIIGWARTRELLLLGNVIDSQTALQWGLLNRVVARSDLDLEVDRVLDSLLENGNQAVRLQKQLMRRWERSAIDDAVQAGIDTFEQAWNDDEPSNMLGNWVTRK